MVANTEANIAVSAKFVSACACTDGVTPINAAARAAYFLSMQRVSKR